MRKMVFVLVFFILVVSPVWADHIEHCTTEEAQEFLDWMEDSKLVGIFEYKVNQGKEVTDISEYDDIFEDMLTVRNVYFLNKEDVLSDCYEVNQFDRSFGHYVSNITLNMGVIVVIVESGDLDRWTPDIDSGGIIVNELEEEYLLWIEEIEAIAEED